MKTPPSMVTGFRHLALIALMMLCQNSCLFGSSIRFSVEHLQASYGNDLVAFHLNKDGTLSATALDASRAYNHNVAILNGQRRDVYPPPGTGILSRFNSAGDTYTQSPAQQKPLGTINVNGNQTSIDYDAQGYDITLSGSNRQGVIVGNQQGIVNGAVLNHGFVYDPATGGRLVQQLGGVRVVEFQAVNDAGYLVGYGLGATVPRGHLYLWRDGEPAIPLVTTSSGSANAINAAAQVVGYADGGAFFWDSGNLYRPVHKLVEDPAHLGTFNEAVTFSYGEDLTEDGLVVGSAELRSVPGFTPVRSGSQAWIWSQDGGLLWLDDLIDPSLNFQLWGALEISDTGQILARGTIGNSNVLQDFLLTPTPEPSTLGLALFGMSLYFRRRR